MFIAPSDLKVIKMGLLKKALSHFKNDDVAKVNNVFTSSANHKKQYQALADSNPYANPVYKESGWQKFLSSLGFRTDKDRYLEGMSVQAQEYDNALLQKEYNEQYDSALAQAQREREAGLNPNLTGNVDPGSSSAMAEDGNPPQPSESDLGQVSEFASNVLNAVQMAYGLFSSGISVAGAMQDLKGKGIANRIASIEENNKLFDFAEDAVIRVLPSVKDLEGEGEVSNYYNALKSAYGGQMSKKQFKKFMHYAQQFQNNINVDDKYFEKLSKRAKNRKDYFGTVANTEAYSEVDTVMYAISEELSNLATRVFKAESTYKAEYAEGLDARAIANAESANAGLDTALKSNEKLMSDFKVQLRSSFKNIMDKLDSLSNEGSWFAPYVKTALSVLLLKQFNF